MANAKRPAKAPAPDFFNYYDVGEEKEEKRSVDPASESFLSGDEEENDGGKFAARDDEDDSSEQLKVKNKKPAKKTPVPAKKRVADKEPATTRATKRARVTPPPKSDPPQRSKPGSHAKREYFRLSNEWQHSDVIPHVVMMNMERLVYACNEFVNAQEEADGDDGAGVRNNQRLVITKPARALMRSALARGIDFLVQHTGEVHRDTSASDRLCPMDVRTALKTNPELAAMDVELLLKRQPGYAPIVNTLIGAMADAKGYETATLNYEHQFDDSSKLTHFGIDELLAQQGDAKAGGEEEEEEDDEGKEDDDAY